MRSPPDRGACALRVHPHRRAHTPNSLRVVSLPSCLQSSQDDADATSRDESELSELVDDHVRVERGVSAMAARHRER